MTLAGGSISKSYQDNYFYSSDTYNNVTEVDEYAFGNTTTPLRKTLTTYGLSTNSSYTSLGLISLPTQKTVTDGSNNPLSQSKYFYDQTTPQSYPAITSYDPYFSATARGNVTTVSQWLNDPVNPRNLSTTYGYDMAGNLVSMVDPRGVTRTWGYADACSPGATCPGSYAFPTSIGSFKAVNPANGATPDFTASLTWDYNIGKPTSTTDINNNPTSYT